MKYQFGLLKDAIREVISEALIYEKRIAPIPADTLTKNMKVLIEKYLLQGPGLRAELQRMSDERSSESAEMFAAMFKEMGFDPPAGDPPESIAKEVADGAVMMTSTDKSAIVYVDLPEVLIAPDISAVANMISEFAKARGWYVNRVPEKVTPSSETAGLKAYYKWTITQNYTARLEKIPPVLWHATPTSNVQVILKKGLIPKAGGRAVAGQVQRTNLAQIYVAGSLNTAKKFSSMTGGDYTILKIDTTKLAKGTKFFYDAEQIQGTEDAYWTASSIPATAISVFEEKPSEPAQTATVQ